MATRLFDPPPPYPGESEQPQTNESFNSCPNGCETGVLTHGQLKDHLLDCPLQLVECEFASAGCDVKVPRRDLAGHMTENAQHHLMTATLLNLRLTRELHQRMDQKDKQISELQSHNGYICHDLVLDNFHKFLRASASKWVSHALRDALVGYHFTIEIGTNLAFTHIMVWLNWVTGPRKAPLKQSSKPKCRVILKMLNQNQDSDHYTVTYDADFASMYKYSVQGETAFRRRIGKTDVFYSIDELTKGAEYLRNNQLRFRVYLKTDCFSGDC